MKRRKENKFLFLSGFKDLERLWASKPMRLGLVGILFDPPDLLRHLPVGVL